MNVTTAQTGIHETHSFEVDEFNFICGPICGGSKIANVGVSATNQQVLFEDIFSDDKTRLILLDLLNYVRRTSETISYPYRCDTESHSIYLRAIVSKSSSMRVGFVSKVLGYEPRPGNTRLECYCKPDDPDYSLCSICNRIDVDGAWLEFQELVEQGIWPASGKPLGCAFDTCVDCERALCQRVAETQRSYDTKTA